MSAAVAAGAGGSWRLRFASGFGLAAFALALPLVRTLVDAPEFFVAHDLGRAGTVLYLLVLIVVVPAVLGLAAAMDGSLGVRIRLAVVAVLGGMAMAGVAQPVSGSTGLFLGVVVVGGVGLALADQGRPAVRATLAYLLVVPLLLVGWSFGPSRVGSYLRSGEASVIETRSKGPLAPVVVLVFDEMPLTALLRRDLTIDPVKFPNLAALAATSDWFRMASSVSPQTSASVPALLSGQEPDLDKVPVSGDYPQNLFLQLGRTHEVHAVEPLSALCPGSVCGATAVAVAGATQSTKVTRPSVFGDSWLVLRHALGTDSIRDRLPSISQGWAGFGNTASLATADEDAEVPDAGYGTFPNQVKVLQDLIATKASTKRPFLLVGHLLAPHLPWVAMPDGSTYAESGVPGVETVDGALTWTGTEAERRQGYQRLLLQLGALDRALGEARAGLEASGLWDDALVVVTADHGIQFEPGPTRAVGIGGAEVSAVPLLVKRPHQTKGRVDDRAALTIDLVPTVLGQLGVSSPSRFDGRDLYRDDIPATRSGAFLASAGSKVTPDQQTEALRRVVKRRAKWIDPDGGWMPVYQPGIAPVIARAEVSGLDVGPDAEGTFTRTGRRDRFVHGRLEGVGSGWLALGCNGRIAGLAPTAIQVSLFLDVTVCGPKDTPDAWIVDADQTLHPLRSASS